MVGTTDGVLKYDPFSGPSDYTTTLPRGTFGPFTTGFKLLLLNSLDGPSNTSFPAFTGLFIPFLSLLT